MNYTNLQEEPPDHTIGRSRGGVSTKIHYLVDGRGLPLVVLVGTGQAGDAPMFSVLLERLRVARRGPGKNLELAELVHVATPPDTTPVPNPTLIPVPEHQTGLTFDLKASWAGFNRRRRPTLRGHPGFFWDHITSLSTCLTVTRSRHPRAASFNSSAYQPPVRIRVSFDSINISPDTRGRDELFELALGAQPPRRDMRDRYEPVLTHCLRGTHPHAQVFVAQEHHVGPGPSWNHRGGLVQCGDIFTRHFEAEVLEQPDHVRCIGRLTGRYGWNSFPSRAVRVEPVRETESVLTHECSKPHSLCP